MLTLHQCIYSVFVCFPNCTHLFVLIKSDVNTIMKLTHALFQTLCIYLIVLLHSVCYLVGLFVSKMITKLRYVCILLLLSCKYVFCAFMFIEFRLSFTLVLCNFIFEWNLFYVNINHFSTIFFIIPHTYLNCKQMVTFLKHFR